MNIHCLYEGTSHSAQAWQEILNLSHDEVETLVKDRVFSPSTTKGIFSLRLDLVGLITLTDRTFFCMPKIYEGIGCDHSDYSLTLRVIRKFIAETRRHLGASVHGGEDYIIDKGNTLDLFLLISDRTERHGFHSETQENFTLEPSSIDWDRTMRNSLAVHQQNSIIYASPYYIDGQSTITALGHIQALCLLDLHEKLSTALNLLNLNNSALIETAITVDSQFDIWTHHDISIAIAQAEECLFRDDERDLIHLVKSWHANLKVRGNIIAIMGVNAFHVVWESMCIRLLEHSGRALKHEDIAIQPRYEVGEEVVRLPAQRPDILLETEDGILLADAKWYDADRNSLPGTQDAIKQLAYQSSITSKKTIISNSYLFPTVMNVSYRRIGKLTFQHSQNIEVTSTSIGLYTIGWRVAAESYVNINQSQVDWSKTL